MKPIKRALISSLFLPLAACVSLVPEFSKPENQLNQDWSQVSADSPESPLKTGALLDIKWWRVFNDPILDQLVETAWKQNYSLEISGLRILEAQAQLAIASGNRFPQTQALSGDVSRVSPAANSSPLGKRSNFTNYSLGGGVAWEIDFWGRFDAAIQSADAAFMASIAERDQALILLSAQVVDTYVQIRINEQLLSIAKENEVIQQRSYDIAKVLFDNGSDSELDMQQAKTLLLSTQAAIPGYSISLVRARNALSILLGKAPGSVEKMIAHNQAIPSIPDAIEIGIPADLLRRRPDVRQAELLARAQNARVGYAKTDLYPRFSLTGSVGLSSSSSFGDLFRSDAVSYAIGPSFVWPFLNYGRIENSIRVQDARLQQALIGYQQTVIQAAREVEDAMASLTGFKQQASLFKETVISAQRSNELAVLQYKEGLADYQRVLDSQRALFSQQQNYVNVKGNYVRSMISLYKALGGGWQQQSDLALISEHSSEQMQQRTDWGEVLNSKTAPRLSQ